MSPNIVEEWSDSFSEKKFEKDPLKYTFNELAKIFKPEDGKSILRSPFKTDIVWGYVLGFSFIHAVAIYVIINAPYLQKMGLFFWSVVLTVYSGVGVTAGVHRLWTHRTYKAKLPVRIILMISYLLAGQYSCKMWIRDHRIHHKYSDTDADPHNSKRGFFFSHMGWLMLKRHPEMKKKIPETDLSDIDADPVTYYAWKYHIWLLALCCYVIPIGVPLYLWEDSVYWTVMSQITRHAFQLNFTFSVNSFAHFFGTKPYNRNIVPVENKYVSFFSLGEGWHNYHHTFPTDYRAAEFGERGTSMTTSFIEFFSKIGWTYDLKTPSDSLVNMTIARRGDATYLKTHQLTEKKNEAEIEQT